MPPRGSYDTSLIRRKRLNPRIRDHEDELIRQAAKLARKTPSEFCRDATLEAARRYIATGEQR